MGWELERQHLLDIVSGNLPLHPDGCILCRRVVAPELRTREHVIPKWALRRFNIWNNNLGLLNGSDLPYRQLTVAACKDCNSRYLKRLEDAVEKAVRGGFEAVNAMPRGILMMWLSKIVLGILLKECELLADRRDPSKGYILRPEFLTRFSLLNFHLQSIRTANYQSTEPVSSIVVFKCKVPQRVEEQFDFFDCFDLFGRSTATACIRLGDAGIACHFFDLHMTDEVISNVLRQEAPLALHPKQFKEICCRFMYKASLLFMKVQADVLEADDRLLVAYRPDDGREYRDWKNEEYAQLLGFHLNFPYERLFEGSKVRTWLMDAGGNFLDIPLENDLALE